MIFFVSSARASTLSKRLSSSMRSNRRRSTILLIRLPCFNNSAAMPVSIILTRSAPPLREMNHFGRPCAINASTSPASMMASVPAAALKVSTPALPRSTAEFSMVAPCTIMCVKLPSRMGAMLLTAEVCNVLSTVLVTTGGIHSLQSFGMTLLTPLERAILNICKLFFRNLSNCGLLLTLEPSGALRSCLSTASETGAAGWLSGSKVSDECSGMRASTSGGLIRGSSTNSTPFSV
mmetsp:Transcript_24777/g.46952  ORF Transcript_24777/g.46952 Transcript_24777/m.46952 type:complete len:235 (+) Transcript_24777:491-1195(+)